MQIFLIDGSNSRFVEITPYNLKKYIPQANYVWDYNLDKRRVASLIASGQLSINHSHVLWSIYEQQGKPGDYKIWLEQLKKLVELKKRELDAMVE